QEGNRAGDFFGLAKTLQGNLAEDGFGKFVHLLLREAHAIKNRRFNWARRDGIDADAALDQLRSKGTRKGTQRGFGRRVDRGVGGAFDAGDTGIQHDGCAFVQIGKRFLNAEVSTLRVDVEDFVKVGFIRLADWNKLGNAGVDEKHVDFA